MWREKEREREIESDRERVSFGTQRPGMFLSPVARAFGGRERSVNRAVCTPCTEGSRHQRGTAIPVPAHSIPLRPQRQHQEPGRKRET